MSNPTSAEFTYADRDVEYFFDADQDVTIRQVTASEQIRLGLRLPDVATLVIRNEANEIVDIDSPVSSGGIYRFETKGNAKGKES